MNIPILIIKTSFFDKGVVYAFGQKYIENNQFHSINNWIRLGIIICQHNLPIEAIKQVFISEQDVSNLDLIWSFPENLEDLNEELKNIIMKEVNEYGREQQQESTSTNTKDS
jgi:hypothetical protein